MPPKTNPKKKSVIKPASPQVIKIQPKIIPKKIIKTKSFSDKYEEMLDSLDINDEDVPDYMLDDWKEISSDLKEKFSWKNLMIWTAIFSPLILPSYVKGVSGKVELPPDAIKPSVMVPAPDTHQVVNYAKEYFIEHGLELVKTLTETDCNTLKTQMISNWGQGERSFTNAFKEDYINSKARLETIFRTEYGMAQNNGILARAKNAKHEYKVWNCALDERSCPECSGLHGQITPIDEPFPGTDDLMAPPYHPNCRCVLTSLTDDEFDEMPDEQFSDENLPDNDEEWDEEMKQDAAYLDEVATIMKQNYNCPADEKSGSGPGSCGGKSDIEDLSNFSMGPSSKKERPTGNMRLVETKLETMKPEVANRVMKHVEKLVSDEPIFAKFSLNIKSSDLRKHLSDKESKAAYAIHDKSSITLNERYFNNLPEFKAVLDAQEKSGWHPKGCNTPESIVTHEMGHFLFEGMEHTGDERLDAINEVIQNAAASGELAKVSRYADKNYKAGNIMEAQAEIYTSVYNTPENNQNEIVKKVSEILKNKIKSNESYLSEAYDVMKLNYNCPDSEKSGSGPGSCGGNTKSESNNSSNKKISVINPSESQLVIKGTRLPTDTEKNIVSEISKTIPPEMMKWAGDLDIRNSGLEVVVTSSEYEAIPNHGWTSHAMVNRIFLQDNVFKSIDKIKAIGEGTIKHEMIHALVGSKIDSYIPGGGRSVLAKEGIRMPIHAYDSDHNGGSIDEFYTMVMENYRGNGEFNDEELSKIEVEKELGKGKWGDYLHSDRWTPAEIEKVKSVVLKWTNDENMLNTFLSKERKLKQWEDEDAALQNSAYLNDAVDFIKMNYNCPGSEKSGEGPGSCGGSNEIHKDLPNGYKLTIKQSKFDKNQNTYEVTNSKGQLVLSTPYIKKLEKYTKDIKSIPQNPKPESKTPESPVSKPPEPTGPELKSGSGKVTLTWTAPDSPSRMTSSQFRIQFPNKAATAITVRYPKSDTKAAPRLTRVLASVPPKLAVNVKKFTLTDSPDKTDAIASKQYGKEFTTAASFNKVDQSIAFFGRNGFTASISKDVLIHELTHALDTKLGNISRTKEYKQAVEMDSKLGKKSEFTSNYARDSYKVKYNDPLEEDMADGIPQYLKDGNKFSERFPNRAAFYKKMLGE